MPEPQSSAAYAPDDTDPASAREDTHPWCPWCERWQAEQPQYDALADDGRDFPPWADAWCWTVCKQADDPEGTLLAVQAERNRLRQQVQTFRSLIGGALAEVTGDEYEPALSAPYRSEGEA